MLQRRSSFHLAKIKRVEARIEYSIVPLVVLSYSSGTTKLTRCFYLMSKAECRKSKSLGLS